MTKVYHLYHYKIGPDEDFLNLFGEEGEIHVGLFSSREKAEETIRVLREKPGFCKWPGGFRILHSILDDYAFKEGFFSTADDDEDARAEG